MEGTCSMQELDTLHDIADGIMGNTICAFGEGTAMPALGYLKKFRKEFEAYVRGDKSGKDARLTIEPWGAS
jgi:NADH-quinone oxidoreductase subunit F